MYDVLRKELESLKAFSTPDVNFINTLVTAIPFTTVPHKMKVAFVLAHLSHFASQFRRNMLLWDGAEVPTNNITFVIADSGANKDSANSKMKACFKPGFKIIEEYLKDYTKDAAIKAAENAGEELPTEPSVYSKYRKAIPPPFTGFSTGPGLVQHISDAGELPVSATMQYSGEYSDELASNPSTTEIIKVMSEVYDLGNRESTYTKNKEFRTGTIKNQPVCALYVGSPGHILYDEATRKKFHISFMSKLARRSWFCYAPERIPEPDFSQAEDVTKALIEYSAQTEAVANEAAEKVKDLIINITNFNMQHVGTTIGISEEVFNLFNLYKRYNYEVNQKRNTPEAVYSLVRAHLQWKALKLAGALAVMDCSDNVEKHHYILAIQFCEMFDKDIEIFEQVINKSPYEQLADYLRREMDANGKAFINIHDIKKRGFASSVSRTKLQELVSLCAGYDKDGLYSLADADTGIIFEAVNKTDSIGVSYKPLDMSKLHEAISQGAEHEVVKQLKISLGYQANEGYRYDTTTFAELGKLLQIDASYSPFNFEDGIRNKDGIIGGTKWLVMDVDNTTLSAEDAHFVLEGYNHYIVLTSDATNHYKYRVLLELDANVELSAIAWKRFYMLVADDFGLDVDPLPQSQIFFSYANRQTYSCLDGEPIATRDYIMLAKEKEQSLDRLKNVTKSQRNAMLDEPLETFWYAFNCDVGQRSRMFYRALRHAKDLDADLEYTLTLLDDINDYIIHPLEPVHIDRLKEQATRLYGALE